MRTGERFLYTLRVKTFAHLQRLGLDYYEKEMSGRIMTRMTTDVDAFSTFLQTGLTTTAVSLLTFVGILIALLYLNLQLGLVIVAVLPIMIVATLDLPQQVVEGVHGGSREGQHRQRRPPGERRRHAGGPGLPAGAAQRGAVRRPQRCLPGQPDAGAALHRDVLPVRTAAVRRRVGGGADRRCARSSTTTR